MNDTWKSLLYKIGLYILFFFVWIGVKPLHAWLYNMDNMVNAMILMAVVMIVDLGWKLCHAHK